MGVSNDTPIFYAFMASFLCGHKVRKTRAAFPSGYRLSCFRYNFIIKECFLKEKKRCQNDCYHFGNIKQVADFNRLC